MGASSKFFKSLISGKRGGGASGAVSAAPVITKAQPETKALSTTASEKGVSERAPSERSVQSDREDIVVSEHCTTLSFPSARNSCYSTALIHANSKF